MTHPLRDRSGPGYAAMAAAFCGGGYAAFTAMTWLVYGHVGRSTKSEEDPLLDSFMPRYDVVDRVERRVRASAEVAFEAAEQQDLMAPPLVRGIFRLRQIVMGAPFVPASPQPLLEQMKALGWVELARVRGREVVMGAVTQPWEGNVVFRPVPSPLFAAFDEPGYVKIAWTLRADPVGPDESIFRTETRAIATDANARARFRNYWAFVSPGIWLIRRLTGPAMARRAERHHVA